MSGFVERMLERRGEQRLVRDAYGLALFSLLASILLLIASGSPLVSPVALIGATLIFAAMLITFRVSGVSPRGFVVVAVTLGTLGGAALSSVFFAGDIGRVMVLAAWLVFTLAGIGAIARRLRTYREVTVPLVLGLLCIYLLLGLVFALGYSFIDALLGASLDPPGQGIAGSLYFSFITLATVGYGDLTPAVTVVRAMAVAESIVGQLYLVSIVSLAVSRLRIDRRHPADPEETS